MIISNTSPLIYLAKLNKLELVRELFNKIIIPKEVYDEVIKGKEEKYFDAIKIENSVKNGLIEVKEITIGKELKEFAPEIDIGELSVIQLALKLKPEMILIDDASARAIAESFGFNVKGTLYVLLKGFRKKMIDKKQIKILLNDIVTAGFRISSELYGGVLEEIDKG